jgi:hypothetical protein
LRNFGGSRALELSEGASALVQLPAIKEDNEINCRFSIEPKEKLTMKGTGVVTVAGTYSNYEAAAKSGFDAFVKPYVEGAFPQAAEIKAIPKVFEKEKIVAEVSFEIDLAKSAETKGFKAYLQTGFPSASIVMENSFSREKRELPLLLNRAGSESYEISMKIPEGFKLFNNLQGINKAGGGLQASQTFKKDGDKITISYSVDAKDKIIRQEDYSKARESSVSLLVPSARTLIFEEVKK